jgi:hypothetical protein
MVTILFALLTVIGSWFAWRSNPMYSRSRTLYFLIAVGLSVAAAIAIFVAIIHFTEHRSLTIQFTAIFSAVFVCTIGLIWIIVTVTTPKTARIPQGTKLLTFHRRRLIPWLKRALWTLGILGLLALIPGPAHGFNWVQFFALFLGAWVLGLGGIMLAAGYIGARNMDRALTAIEANAWVHWSYTPAEWTSLIDIQIARAQAREQKKALDRRVPKWVVLPLTGIPLYIGLYLAGVQTFWIGALASLGFACLVYGSIVLSDRNTAAAPKRLRSRLATAATEAWLAPDGLFANGEYQPWISSGVFLLEATCDTAQPRSLYFQFEKIQPGNTAPISTYIHQYVFVPSSLDQATLNRQFQTLQRELNAIAKTARVHIL